MNDSSQVLSIGAALRLAQQQLQAGKAAEATHICQQILQQFPEQPDACNLLGMIQYQYGAIPEAIELLTTAARQRNYRNPHCFSNLAELLRRSNRLSEAEHYARHSLTLDPNFYEGLCNLAIILQEKGDNEAALSLLLQAQGLKADNAALHNNLGKKKRRSFVG